MLDINSSLLIGGSLLAVNHLDLLFTFRSMNQISISRFLITILALLFLLLLLVICSFFISHFNIYLSSVQHFFWLHLYFLLLLLIFFVFFLLFIIILIFLTIIRNHRMIIWIRNVLLGYRYCRRWDSLSWFAGLADFFGCFVFHFNFNDLCFGLLKLNLLLYSLFFDFFILLFHFLLFS